MKTLKNWVVHQKTENYLELLVDNLHMFRIYVLEENLFRVLIKKQGELSLDRTWCIDPSHNLPWQGRHRESTAGFLLPTFHYEKYDDKCVISTAQLKVTIHQPLWLEWEYYDVTSQDWQLLATDRPTGAYQLNMHGDGIAHFQRRFNLENYYGLGEKAGDLNRKMQRYEMRNLDAMGYNARTTDPLYKHIPFTITHRGDVSFGLFYDNLSHSWFDLGNELDNYHVPFRRYQAEAGDLDYYLFAAPKIIDITKQFVRLTGKTFFGPRWSLGYSGSTMHYTDAPDAQNQLMKFITLCQENEIPCDSFQLSSGYTSINNKRYVFNWNYDKVPEPKKMSHAFHQAGLKLAANIKPCLLQDHPKYQEVASRGLFITDSCEERPERSSFWDDEGSNLDFTNPATISWWQQNIKSQLLEMGIDSTWNDNNEFEVWDNEAKCCGFGQPIAIKHIRPVMSLLMMRASFDAQKEFAPKLRPYLISRSGCPGMQRYVQTWSGDNRTSWETLKYNIRMGLGMSLSGLYNIGHDVGGFAGQKPEMELFIRWVQNGVMHPRFTIHSWNDDHSVNEPWMYPQATPIIREIIELRYRLMPYLYTLLWGAHINDEPMLRPTFLDHQHDPNTFIECDDFMLGKDLLIASVVEKDQRKRDVYLPDNEYGWYDFYSEQWHLAGQTITVDAPLERLPLLVRAGSAIPLSKRLDYTDPQKDDYRELKLFPTKGNGKNSGILFEDDGESDRWQHDHAFWLRWEMVTTRDTISLQIMVTGTFKPAWKTLTIVLPKDESRLLLINGKNSDQFIY